MIEREVANGRLLRQLRFIKEIDGLKDVWRQTYRVDGSRRENDAEHTWEIMIMAVTLYEYAPPGTSLFHALKMLLFHDLVELYAGDTFAYDADSHRDKNERESRAAERVFSLLPKDQHETFRRLWQEYEDADTASARFARCMDRLQPFLHNIHSRGGTWKQHGIRRQQVLERNRDWMDQIPALGELVEKLSHAAVKEGFLLE